MHGVSRAPAVPQVAKTHSAQFLADGTHNLITRLHHNVIRTGLRRINLAYSRISLADIAAKLHLASADDAGERSILNVGGLRVEDASLG